MQINNPLQKDANWRVEARVDLSLDTVRTPPVTSSSSSLTSLLTSDDTREAHSFLESDQYYPNTAAPGGGLAPDRDI